MRIKALSCWGVGILFIVAGANHFASPDSYQAMMPPLLPWPMALIYISGAAEILGGVGVLLARVRRLSGLGLMALLVAVFPANVFAAIHGFNGLILSEKRRAQREGMVRGIVYGEPGCW